MAVILDISKQASFSSRNGNVVNVKCVYEKGFLSNGTSCVVLKTYNPASRNGGISQTLHITRDIALQLIDIFNKEFGL